MERGPGHKTLDLIKLNWFKKILHLGRVTESWTFPFERLTVEIAVSSRRAPFVNFSVPSQNYSKAAGKAPENLGFFTHLGYS